MTHREPNAPSGPSAGTDAAPRSDAALGLRLRIWLGCLAGALVTAMGIWWVAGTQLTLDPDPPQLLGWLAAIGGLGLVVSIGLALWLDHGIVSHLRGLTRSLALGRVQELRGLPSASGWGELSDLTEWAQVLITRQRFSSRASEELERLEATLALALERLEGWRRHDRWEPLPADPGTGGALARELNETFARAAEQDEQNREAARRVRAELIGAAADARDSSAQAERGFVEATALLTTVRELQRLGGELRQALASREGREEGALEATLAEPAAGEPAAAGAAGAPVGDERAVRYRDAVEAALEELIDSSNASVGHLGTALRRVQEIAGQVQLVSQRATLVALHAVTLESRLPREERQGEDLSRELRLLTGEVRAASQQADALAAEVERETRAADERMRALRERVAPQLEPPVVEPAAIAAAPLSEPAMRLLERVREMIQDATQKGERLSAAGERASRTADRLLRRLEDEAREVEGLMVRLSPAGELPVETGGDLDDDAMTAPADLRLLDAGGAADLADETLELGEAGGGGTRALPGEPAREDRS